MRQASGSRGEELDCQRYVALDDLVDECSGALDLHVSIETPALSRRVSSSICAARRSASFSRPALSSSTANRSRRSKGISESRRPSQASRQGNAAYPSSYSRDPAHAARRADLGGSRFPRHVARGPAGPLRALPPPIICKALRPQSSKKAGMFRWLNRWLTRE